MQTNTPLPVLFTLQWGKLDKAFETFNKTNRWGAYSTPTIRYLFPDLLQGIRTGKRFERVLNNANSSWEFT